MEDHSLDRSDWKVKLRAQTFELKVDIRAHKFRSGKEKTRALTFSTYLCSELGDTPDRLRLHIIDPEAPATHAIVGVNALPSSGQISQLDWSPRGCSPALLCVQSEGACTILTPPAYAAHTIDAWTSAIQWSDQEAFRLAKWLKPPSPVRLKHATCPAMGPSSMKSQDVGVQNGFCMQFGVLSCKMFFASSIRVVARV